MAPNERDGADAARDRRRARLYSLRLEYWHSLQALAVTHAKEKELERVVAETDQRCREMDALCAESSDAAAAIERMCAAAAATGTDVDVALEAASAADRLQELAQEAAQHAALARERLELARKTRRGCQQKTSAIEEDIRRETHRAERDVAK